MLLCKLFYSICIQQVCLSVRIISCIFLCPGCKHFICSQLFFNKNRIIRINRHRSVAGQPPNECFFDALWIDHFTVYNNFHVAFQRFFCTLCDLQLSVYCQVGGFARLLLVCDLIDTILFHQSDIFI